MLYMYLFIYETRIYIDGKLQFSHNIYIYIFIYLLLYALFLPLLLTTKLTN
jgi:hypothetical protein